MADGKIIKTGNKELAIDLEKSGYEFIDKNIDNLYSGDVFDFFAKKHFHQSANIGKSAQISKCVFFSKMV